MSNGSERTPESWVGGLSGLRAEVARLTAENEKLRVDATEAHALAKDWFEESERGFDKLVAIREWFADNQEHEVYEATDEQPAECTEECPACALGAILDARVVTGGALHALGAERDALQAQLDSMTVEAGVKYHPSAGVVPYPGEKQARAVSAGFAGRRIMKRLVGPWVEVTD
jgi:hypothetical protein